MSEPTVQIDDVRLAAWARVHQLYAYLSDARMHESVRGVVCAIDRRTWLALALAVIGGVMMGRATAPRKTVTAHR